MLEKILTKFDQLICAAVGLVFDSPMSQTTARQFIKFSLIGVVNTAIDFGIYAFLTRVLTVFSAYEYWLYAANCLSFLCGTTFSFFANRSWTFGMSEKANVEEAGKFYATTLSGLAVNNVILYFAVSLFGINDLASKAISTVFSTVWNFSLKRLWVFAPKTSETAEAAPLIELNGKTYHWTNL